MLWHTIALYILMGLALGLLSHRAKYRPAGAVEEPPLLPYLAALALFWPLILVFAVSLWISRDI